jgi:hypothetical protein
MKKSLRLQEALARLRGNQDFDIFVAELEGYLATMTERLIHADDERLQVAQGMCRAISSLVDTIKGK